MQQKKLIFNFFVNRNWKKLTDSRKRAKILTDSRKRAKILADNRKSHHPIETLLKVRLADINIASHTSCSFAGIIKFTYEKKKEKKNSGLHFKNHLKYPIFIGIPDSLSCITFSKAQDSGFHNQKYPGFICS